MRDGIFTICAVALAVTAVGVGATSYRAVTARILELERQKAALRGGYDELRGGYIECLVREEERIVADTYAGVDVRPQLRSNGGHRARDAVSTDTYSAVVSPGTSSREGHRDGAYR